MPTRPLSDDEITKILSNPKSFNNLRDKTMFLLQLYTGLRGAEVCSLRLNQVYKPSFGSIRCLDIIGLDISQMKGKKKGRSIHVPSPLKDALNSWILEWERFINREITLKSSSLPKYTKGELYKENAKRQMKGLPLINLNSVETIEYNEMLFPSTKVSKKKRGFISVSRSSYNDILRDVFHRNDIIGADRELGTHSLRKSYIVDLYNNDKLKSDPLLLIKCTGHQRLETLQHYVGIHDDDVKNAQLRVHQNLLKNPSKEILLVHDEFDFK